MYDLNVSSVNPDQAFEILLACVDKCPVLLHGTPGVGKTTLARRLAERLNRLFISCCLSQFPSEEVSGIMIPVKNENGTYRTLRSIPDFLPTSGSGILFFDEINHADTATLNAIFQLILERQLAGGQYKLPDGWYVLAACNDFDSNENVTEFSPPLNNRFLHLSIKPDIHQWLEWAKNHNIASSVLSFLERNPSDLAPNVFQENTAFPTPRSWVKLSEFESIYSTLDKTTYQAIVHGLLGKDVGGRFLNFRRLEFKSLDADKILRTPVEKPLEFGDAGATFCIDNINLIASKFNQIFPGSSDRVKPRLIYNLVRSFKGLSVPYDVAKVYIQSAFPVLPEHKIRTLSSEAWDLLLEIYPGCNKGGSLV